MSETQRDRWAPVVEFVGGGPKDGETMHARCGTGSHYVVSSLTYDGGAYHIDRVRGTALWVPAACPPPRPEDAP